VGEIQTPSFALHKNVARDELPEIRAG